jgi:hypothetical protein
MTVANLKGDKRAQGDHSAWSHLRHPFIIAVISIIVLSGSLLPFEIRNHSFPIVSASSSAVAGSRSNWDPVKGHSYPRRGIVHWGGASVEWYAQFDLIVTSSADPEFAAGVKAINPYAIILPTRDINAGNGADPYYDEWTCLHSNDWLGEKEVTIYGGSCPLADITDWCPLVDGKRYNDAVPEYMSQLGGLPYFDGVATDGLWGCPWGDGQQDIDLDRNGENDNQQENRGRSWVCSEWIKGAGKAVTRMRQLLGDDKVILINGTSLDGFRDQFNGVNLEYGGAFSYKWYSGYATYNDLMASLREPHTIYIDGCSAWQGLAEEESVRNNFQLFRFILATTLLGDGYVGFQSVYRDHYFLSYYDELDLDLGYPTSTPIKIDCIGSECIFVRFFDNGVVILNVTGAPVTITDDKLRELQDYYNGPYYRFLGGQDPAWNDGQRFISANLDGFHTDDGAKYMGDALILVNRPSNIIADIVVDHTDMATSPGSRPSELTGDWQEECAEDSWSQGCYRWIGGYGHAYTRDNAGVAIYRPTIGISGDYDVFEWHGTPLDGQAATRVSYVIAHADGQESIVVDQSVNTGQWNGLGTFAFDKGTAGSVTISAQGADGTVMADAVKFVWRDSGACSGDLNSDGCIDTVDLQLMGNVLLHGNSSNLCVDLNGNGVVNILDLQLLVNRILSQ